MTEPVNYESASAEPTRLLVVANRTCPCPALLDEVSARHPDPQSGVLIVAPALRSRLKHWSSDSDESVRGARSRLEEARAGLAERGITARGEIGDAEPLTAISDALVTFQAGEIIIGTHPPGASHWLEKGLIEQVREAFPIPVTHIESRYGVVHERQASV